MGSKRKEMRGFYRGMDRLGRVAWLKDPASEEEVREMHKSAQDQVFDMQMEVRATAEQAVIEKERGNREEAEELMKKGAQIFKDSERLSYLCENFPTRKEKMDQWGARYRQFQKFYNARKDGSVDTVAKKSFLPNKKLESLARDYDYNDFLMIQSYVDYSIERKEYENRYQEWKKKKASPYNSQEVKDAPGDKFPNGSQDESGVDNQVSFEDDAPGHNYSNSEDDPRFTSAPQSNDEFTQEENDDSHSETREMPVADQAVSAATTSSQREKAMSASVQTRRQVLLTAIIRSLPARFNLGGFRIHTRGGKITGVGINRSVFNFMLYDQSHKAAIYDGLVGSSKKPDRNRRN